MTFHVYSIRDSKANVFMQPTTEVNDQTAVRNFDTAIRRSDDILHFHKEDFDLYKIAQFDSETGVVQPLVPIQLVVSGGSINE